MPTYNAENFSLTNCIKVRKLITDFTPVNTGRLEADGRKFYSVEATVRYLKEQRYTLLTLMSLTSIVIPLTAKNSYCFSMDGMNLKNSSPFLYHFTEYNFDPSRSYMHLRLAD